jgi:hypothetical protein
MAMTYHGRFFFPNRTDDATLLGNGYIDPLPLPNIQDRLLHRVARSVNLDPANTAFIVDFGRPMSIGVLAVIGHNLSLSGRFGIEASNNLDMSSARLETSLDAWPSSSGSWNLNNVVWQSRNFWRGTFAPEDVEGQTTKSVLVLPETVVARYWRITPIDPNNVDGYVDIGRLFMSETFLQPRINYGYGAATGYRTATKVETSLGGVKFFDPRESVMFQQIEFHHLNEEEDYRARELMRRAGIHRELIFVPDPSDRRYGLSRIIYGRFENLNPVQQVMHRNNSVAFNLEDLR